MAFVFCFLSFHPNLSPVYPHPQLSWLILGVALSLLLQTLLASWDSSILQHSRPTSHHAPKMTDGSCVGVGSGGLLLMGLLTRNSSSNIF